ncbi:MAG: hypothetical protein ACREER_05335 [Alphaproteobacteria bacterium]
MHDDPIRDLLVNTRMNSEIEAFDADPEHEHVVVVTLKFRDRRDRVGRQVVAYPDS